FERVGGLKTIKVDVRLITATNRNLFQDVKEGRFREDLFYRLNVLPIHLPALRERKDDIPLLVSYFVDRFRKKLARDIEGLDDEVLDLFINYDWPGNIREMENLLERLVLMARGQTITLADVPGEIRQAVQEQALLPPEKKPSQFKEFIRTHTEEAERQLLVRCLEECGGNVTRAAQQLGLSRKGLQLKMIKYNLRK
ncbi:MAG TPA: sigma 54-interacting transcriptional regulator, partial [Syntrophales bacterium]|nr:sigma 54-interacting transcriptional regulator [Syntrophales bacterium]